MVSLVIRVMYDTCVFYIVLDVLAQEEVVQLGDGGHLVDLVHAGEVDLMLLPEGEEVQLVQHLLNSLGVICMTDKISVNISGPDHRSELSSSKDRLD